MASECKSDVKLVQLSSIDSSSSPARFSIPKEHQKREAGAKDDEDETKQANCCSTTIAPKYQFEGTLILILLALIWITFTAELILTSLDSVRNPPTSTSQESIIGNANYPHFEFCSAWYVNPGMSPSWFKNVSAAYYPNWVYGIVSPDSQPIHHELISAAKYHRNGSCLSVESQAFTVQSNHDFMSIQFGFEPSYKEFCASGWNSVNYTCEVYKDEYPFVSHELEIYVGEEDESVAQKQIFYMPYNNKEITVYMDQVNSEKLDGSISKSWYFTPSTSDIEVFRNEFGTRSFVVRYWFVFANPSMQVVKEVNPVNVFVLLGSGISAALFVVGIWSKLCFRPNLDVKLHPTYPVRKVLACRRWIARKLCCLRNSNNDFADMNNKRIA
mmetsp:Transcript_23414/g.37688  ORF Transcript_23414/g.37688 Transcript_23414/m.37688 type:complete len:385 (-) Transcript_23414:152-1306(-)